MSGGERWPGLSWRDRLAWWRATRTDRRLRRRDFWRRWFTRRSQ